MPLLFEHKFCNTSYRLLSIHAAVQHEIMQPMGLTPFAASTAIASGAIWLDLCIDSTFNLVR